MIGRFKHSVMLLVILMFSFCMFSLHTSAKNDPRIPRNKIVALVYDDSGSMQEQTGTNGKNMPIDNWKYANYALQSFVALMDTQDQLKVVFMSSPDSSEPIELDEKLRPLGIDHIKAWKGKSSTPIASLHTAIRELDKAAESYDQSDFWLIVLTDGVFNELSHLEKNNTQQQIDKNKEELFTRLNDLKKKMEKKGANFQSTLIPIETYLKPEEELIMADFKRRWKESSNGIVLESNGQLNIIDRINEVAALMTNRDPSQRELFQFNPKFEGNQLVLQSPFPLRRLTILEQSEEEHASFQIKGFYMNNKDLNQGMEGPYKIKTPDDPAQLNPPIRGSFTHFKNINGDAIEEGSYKIVFEKPLTEEQKKNLKVLAEPAVDFQIGFQKVNEDGSQTDDSSLFFEGSHMRLEATLIKSESTNEEVDIRDIDVGHLFEVEATIDGAQVPLNYDRNSNRFIGDFTLMQKEDIPVKVKMNIKGFYQKEKETILHGYPIRKMELVANTDSWSARLDKLGEADPLKITPLINGEEMTEQELKEIIPHLKVQTSENIQIVTKQDGNHILIYPKELQPMFRTSVGEIPLHITLPGKYPNELAEGDFHLNVENISIVKKYWRIILAGLLILFLLWYIFGIIRKPRFDKNRIFIEYKQSKRKGSMKEISGITENFHGSWVKRWLVPYVPEKKSIYDLTFKAHRKKDRVLLAKECQDANLIVRHEKLEERSKKEDLLIQNNDEIQIEWGNRKSVYTFKSY